MINENSKYKYYELECKNRKLRASLNAMKENFENHPMRYHDMRRKYNEKVMFEGAYNIAVMLISFTIGFVFMYLLRRINVCS